MECTAHKLHTHGSFILAFGFACSAVGCSTGMLSVWVISIPHDHIILSVMSEMIIISTALAKIQVILHGGSAGNRLCQS